MPVNQTLEWVAPTPPPLSARDRHAFFASLHQGFERAAQKVGGNRSFYQLGGYNVELHFASPLLASGITPALAHRAASFAQPALTVCLWDSATTGVSLSPEVSDLISAARSRWVGILGPRGEIEGYHGGRLRAAYQLGPGILSVLDTERNLAVYWVQDAAQLPWYETAAPLKTILNWWMSEHARQFVHAGAVGTAAGGVLLAGKGGSGKSSTALACLGSPLKIVSDDYALIAVHPEPFVYSLYNTAKLAGQADLERFPHLGARVHNLERLGEEKAMIFLEEHYADELAEGFPIKAVVVPRVTGKTDTKVHPLPPGAALTALAASTLFQLSGSGQTALQMMASLVRGLPRYELALGTDMAQIPRVLQSLL